MFDINEVVDVVYDNITSQSNKTFWGHNSIVVVGDNSSGKTRLIKNLLDLVIKNKNNEFYYIDSCNRQVVDKINSALDIGFSTKNFNP